MKAILISIRPQHTCNILNGIKGWEIRKKFPKDYVGWVYIYCTKDNKQKLCYVPATETFYCYPKDNIVAKQCDRMGLTFNGKVVARFWCDKVEEITTRQDRFKEFMFYETSLDMEDLLKQSCLDYNELDNYLYGENGKAIHINDLEIFDKPKELSEFKKVLGSYDCSHDCQNCNMAWFDNKENKFKFECQLTKAPQSWCYVEI